MIADALRRSLATGKAVARRVGRPVRSGQPIWPRNASFNVAVASLLAAIVLMTVFIDQTAIEWVRLMDVGVQSWFAAITDVGKSGWILSAAAVVALSLSVLRWSALERRRRSWLAALHGDANFVFATVAISGTAVALLKNTLGRARPRFLEQFGVYHYDFAAFEAQFASFPSGHATTSGALAAALALLDRRRAWLWVGLGLVAGASRTMVGAHYPSDVVAGLACGGVFVLLSARFLASRGLMFSLAPGKVVPHRRRYKAAKPRSRSAIRSAVSSNPT